jgi:hypothetical protein
MAALSLKIIFEVFWGFSKQKLLFTANEQGKRLCGQNKLANDGYANKWVFKLIFITKSFWFQLRVFMRQTGGFLSDLCKATATPCTNQEKFSKFRTISGRCNNVQVNVQEIIIFMWDNYCEENVPLFWN